MFSIALQVTGSSTAPSSHLKELSSYRYDVTKPTTTWSTTTSSTARPTRTPHKWQQYGRHCQERSQLSKKLEPCREFSAQRRTRLRPCRRGCSSHPTSLVLRRGPRTKGITYPFGPGVHCACKLGRTTTRTTCRSQRTRSKCRRWCSTSSTSGLTSWRPSTSSRVATSAAVRSRW